jgi:hypothetical protein
MLVCRSAIARRAEQVALTDDAYGASGWQMET